MDAAGVARVRAAPENAECVWTRAAYTVYLIYVLGT
eukprot:COSAG05_NODE_9167_length_642_cov_67769.265193_2_plen_35_part_01